MSLILALDQSTSATKALLFEAGGCLVDRESLDHRQYYPQPGWVEHDAEEIWQNAVTTLRTLLARQAARIPEMVGLSITNQRETVVVFERGTGRPLHPAIVWQCRRGEPGCAALAAAGHDALVHARTGLKIDPYFSGSKLQWLVRHQPGLRARLACGEALIGTIDAYLIYRFTRGRVFATDSTNASRTLLFDITRLQWDDELCALWDVPRSALPEVRESFARFGETTVEGALKEALPICGVMGDSHASLFANRAFEPGMGKVTFGTGSSVLLNVGPRPQFSDRGIVTALGWVRDGVPTYAFEGIIISSAATLTWLRDQLGLFADLAEAEALAASVADCQGVHVIPAFSGLGFPYWRAEVRAAIVGLSAHSDRRHVTRAAVESMAFQLCDVLEAMRAEAAVPLRSIAADGGPTANRLLMQFAADLTRVNLRVGSVTDGSGLGVALAGLLGLGVHPSLNALMTLPRDDKVYAPQMAPEAAGQLHAGWQRAVRQLLAPTN